MSGLGRLTVGTRGSRLAMIQAGIAIDLLKSAAPGIDAVPKAIKTSGDMEQATPLYKMKGEGIFEKEIDMAVVGGDVDFAVHSLKDMPTALPEGIVIAAVPKRAKPNDVLLSRGGIGLDGLRAGAVVGTSSIIRMAELRRRRGDLKVKDIRGNVETRIAKMDRGEYDALLLAEAGVSRLGLADRIAEVLPLDAFTPAAGQGALAVVAAKSRKDVIGLLKRIDDPESRAEVSAERGAISVIGGGCEAAVGAIGRAGGGRLTLMCNVFSTDERVTLSHSSAGAVEGAEALGRATGRELMAMGADKMIMEWHSKIGK